MLWYVQDQENELKTIIERAVDFFRGKYGQTPQVCYVHPDTLPAEFVVKDVVKVMPNERVIKNHIWLEIPTE